MGGNCITVYEGINEYGEATVFRNMGDCIKVYPRSQIVKINL